MALMSLLLILRDGMCLLCPKMPPLGAQSTHGATRYGHRLPSSGDNLAGGPCPQSSRKRRKKKLKNPRISLQSFCMGEISKLGRDSPSAEQQLGPSLGSFLAGRKGNSALGGSRWIIGINMMCLGLPAPAQTQWNL